MIFTTMNFTDFVCGVTAGWAQVLVGQPFDFAKVRIQSALNAKVNIPAIAKDIYRQFGLRGFYRGSSSLLFGFTFIIGQEFLVYQWMKKTIFNSWGQRGLTYNPADLRIWEIGLSGAVVGWSSSFIYCPVQYTKIQRQMNGQMKISSLRFLFKEIAQNGIQNIYKGFWTAVAKQVFGSIFYYSSYEALVRKFSQNNRQSASPLHFMVAGGIAGVTYHILTYPIDIVKTNMQLGLNFKTSLRMALELERLKGYKVVLTRAVLVNSCSFAVYEKMQSYIKQWDNYYYTV